MKRLLAVLDTSICTGFHPTSFIFGTYILHVLTDRWSFEDCIWGSAFDQDPPKVDHTMSIDLLLVTLQLRSVHLIQPNQLSNALHNEEPAVLARATGLQLASLSMFGKIST